MKLLLTCWSFIFWGVAAASRKPRQINPVSVLLPYTEASLTDHRVNVTLQAFGGCYRWRVQRPTVIKIREPFPDELHGLAEDEADAAAREMRASAIVKAEDAPQPGESVGSYDGESSACHNAVVVSQWLSESVSVVASAAPREKSWVFAEDITRQDGGVKCEVYVAPVDKIVIETTAKSLTVGGVETLTIKAFDKEGNVFTSLEGLRFQWEIGDPTVISIASLKNDVYRPTHARRTIHEKGEESDIILLKGLVSGRTSVRARLLEPGYQTAVEETSVWLDVVEPIVAVPSSITVPPLSEINLGVKILKGKESPSHAPLVRLPHKDFKWEVQADVSGIGGDSVSVHSRSGKLVVLREDEQQSAVSVYVADQRNINNTDATTIYIKTPASLRLMQGALASVLNLNASKLYPFDTDLNVKRLEEFAESMFTPVAQPRRLTQLLKAYGGPSRSVWYLPRNSPALVGVDLLTKQGESMFVPPNARFELSTTTEDTSLQALPVSWKGDNLAMFVVLPTEETGYGSLQVSLKAVVGPNGTYVPEKPVSVVQKYVVVNPIALVGLPAMRESEEPASPLPLLLPVHYAASFTLTGGSGNFKLHSSDPSVCSVTKLSDNREDGTSLISIQTSGTSGMATLVLADEMNPDNYYRIHCVSAFADSIEYDPPSRQIPLNMTHRTSAVIPVRATAKLPSSVLAQTPPSWIPLDPSKRTAADWAVVPVTRQFLHFTQCDGITSISVEASGSGPNQGIRHSVSRREVTIRALQTNSLFTCGSVELFPPDSPVVVEIVATLGDTSKPAATMTSTEIEFFAPLGTHIPALEHFKRLHLVDSPINTKDLRLTSSRVSQSIAIAVGSPLIVHLLGGPSAKPGCDHKVTVSTPETRLLSVQPLKSPPGVSASIRSSIKDGVFELVCLDVATLVQVEFTVTTACTNQNDSLTTKLLVGCSLPEFLQVVADDSEQEYRVEPLAPTVGTPDAEQHLIGVLGHEKAGKLLSLTAQDVDSMVYVTCNHTHKFQMVACDSYKRPLLSVSSFSPSWLLYGSKPTSKLFSLAHEAGRADVGLVGVKGCQDTAIVSGAFVWSGEFDLHNLQSIISKHDIAVLKNTSHKLNSMLTQKGWEADAGGKVSHLRASIEILSSPHPRISPALLQNQPLISREEWAYRVITMFGSGRLRFSVSSGGTDSSLAVGSMPRVVMVEQLLGSSTLPTKVRAMPLVEEFASSPSISKIVDLTEWENAEIEKSIPWLDIHSNRLQTPVNFIDALLKPNAGVGSFIFTAEDRSLLGGHILHVPFRFELLTGIDLELLEVTSQDAMPAEYSLRATSVSPALTEIEAGTDYYLNPIARTDAESFPSKLARALSLKIMANPSYDLSVLSTSAPAAPPYVLKASRVGKFFISARLEDEGLSSAPFEVLVHTPLRVYPDELVLLPGGHTWELKIEGGGSGARSYRLESTDSTVAEVDESVAKPILRTNNKGTAMIKILRQSSSSPNAEGVLSKQERSLSVPVTVAHPSKTGVVINGKPFTLFGSSLVALPAHRLHRVLGQLLTADQKPFTLGHLTVPSGRKLGDSPETALLGPVSQIGYSCVHTWASDSPDVVMFVADSEIDAEQLQNAVNMSSNGVVFRPGLEAKLSGHGRIAATLNSLRPGTARVTFSSDCVDRNRWGGPFSKWSDTITMSIVVVGEERGINEFESDLDRHEFSNIRFPYFRSANLQMPLGGSVITKSRDGSTLRSESLCRSTGSGTPVIGEAVKLLGDSQYTFTPHWRTAWTWKVHCLSGLSIDSQDPNRVQGCGTSGAVVQVVKQAEGELGLSLSTGEIVGSDALLELRGGSSTQALHIPVMIVEPVELQVLPMNASTDESMYRPMRMHPGEPHGGFRLVLRDAQKSEILLPDSVPIEVVSSHPSVADVAEPDMMIAKFGVFFLTPGKQGCSAVTVSVPRVMSKAHLLTDVITICSQPRILVDRLLMPEAPKLAPAPPVYERLKLLVAPWLTVCGFSAPWVVVLSIGLLALVNAAVQTYSAPAPKMPLSPMPSSNSPHRKAGSGLARDWVTAATPIAPRSTMSAFPSAKRTYANAPESSARQRF